MNKVWVPSIVSLSNNPATLLLNRYTLTTGVTYQVTATVTVATGESAMSIVTAFVQHNSISASIIGGSTQTPTIGQPHILDAGNSFDKDINPQLPESSASLKFQWSCLITSSVNYGSDCSYLFTNATEMTSSRIVTLSNFTLDTQYTATVVVSAPDGRSSAARVVLNPIPDGVANIAITSNLKKVNYNSQLILLATVKSHAAQGVVWSIAGSSLNLDSIALTKTNTTFSAAQLASTAGAVYPLSIKPYQLIAGRTYVFQLTAVPLNPALKTLSSTALITLTINRPPSSGFLTVSPRNGTALTSVFAASCYQWATEASNYPICTMLRLS